MSWWAVLPGIVGLAALWVLPGYGLLRLLGVRGLVAWGAAAPVTTGVSGVLAIGYALVGLPWTLTTFLLGCLLLLVAAAVIGRALGTVNEPDSLRVAGERRPLRAAERGWLALTWALGGGTLAAAMMVGIGRADMPLQAWDGVFHLNALWFIRETGNASSLGGLAPLYNDQVAPYYPAVWHGLVAIAPGFPRVTEAANGASVVLAAVVWIAGLVALSRVVWPSRALPVVLTPVVAASYVTFPAVAVSMLGVYPFALSTACLPGTLALMIAALRGDQRLALHAVHGLGFLAALGGVVLAHGSGLFSWLLLAGPLLVVLVVRQGRRIWRRGHRVLVGTAGVMAVVGGVGLLVFLVAFPPVAAILDYQRGGQDSYWGPLASLLIDHPLIYVYPIRSVNFAVTALVVVGAWQAVRRTQARWLVVALLAAVAVTLLAAGPPENPLRPLSGFWYTQPSRVNQLLVIPAVVLAAGGAAWVARWLARRTGVVLPVATAAVVLLVVTLTSGLRWATHVEVMASVHNNWPIAWGTMLEKEELAMVDRARETLPDDALVLGEPVNGSSYLLARSDVDVVYPQLSPIPDSPELVLLATRFDQWRSNPEVCEVVRELGVTHVYTDTLSFEEGAKWEETTPGLRDVRPDGPEFQLVDEGGQASLWRFTGCEQ